MFNNLFDEPIYIASNSNNISSESAPEPAINSAKNAKKEALEANQQILSKKREIIISAMKLIRDFPLHSAEMNAILDVLCTLTLHRQGHYEKRLSELNSYIKYLDDIRADHLNQRINSNNQNISVDNNCTNTYYC